VREEGKMVEDEMVDDGNISPSPNWILEKEIEILR